MSDRQIRRYIKQTRERNALKVDKNFSNELLGEIKQQVLNSFSHMIRIARGKEASCTEKIQAELGACNLLFDLAKLLQSSGHLTVQPQMVDAKIVHHVKNLSEQDILDIETAAKESIGLPEKVSKVLTEIRSQIETPPADDPKSEEEPNDSETTE